MLFLIVLNKFATFGNQIFVNSRYNLLKAVMWFILTNNENVNKLNSQKHRK